MTTKKERAAALAAMTKAELVRTVVKLDARTTSLLNDSAKKDSEITKLQLQLLALQLDYDKARCLDTVKIANLRAKFAEYVDGQTDGDDASETFGAVTDRLPAQHPPTYADDATDQTPTNQRFPWEKE